MSGRTVIDLRIHDAKERGNPPTPEAIPYDIKPDDPLAAAVRIHTDALRDRSAVVEKAK